MAQAALPSDHLALVIEDALAAVADGAGGGPAADQAAALLYGWASGAVSARELAGRAQTDPGLSYLLRGQPWPIQEVRAFRDRQRRALTPRYAAALRVCRAAGMARLGDLGLAAASLRPAPDANGAEPYRGLVATLFDRAAAADAREAEAGGARGRAVGVPPQLAERSRRQVAFRRAAAGPGAATGPAATAAASNRLPRPSSATAAVSHPLVRMAAVVAVVLAGLLLVRWVAAATANPVTGSGQFRGGRGVAAGGSAPVEPAVVPDAPAADATDAVDLDAAARDEALRLAGDALASDELSTARDLYFLALQAVPGDPEATDRLRQVDTALGIDGRRNGWDEAVTDLAELRSAAPDSAAVLGAYVTALVGGGRAALADRDPTRAVSLCGEAVRWQPPRADARTCLAQAQAGAGSSATPTRAPPSPSPTATTALPTFTPDAQVRRPLVVPTFPPVEVPPEPASPGAGGPISPYSALQDVVPALERLRDQLSRSATSMPSGTPVPPDRSP